MDQTDHLLSNNHRETLLRISQRIFAKTGEHFFDSLALVLAEELKADYLVIGKLSHDGHIMTVAVADANAILDNFSYELAGTPCDIVVTGEGLSIIENLGLQYPAGIIKDLGIEAYIGAPLFSHGGEAKGGLCALYKRPLNVNEADFIEFHLTIQAPLASSEIERAHTEVQLRNSQYHAREGFNQSPLAMLVLNKSGLITHSNHAFYVLTGYRTDQITGSNLSCMFSSNAQQKTENYLARLMSREASSFKFECSFQSQSKENLEILVHSYSLTSGDEIKSIVLQFENIMERKLAERQLRKLNQSVELSPLATVITDKNALIEYVNPRFTELTGFSSTELMGQKTAINASGETPDVEYKVMWQTIRAGKQWQGELLNKKKDGTTYWARTTIFPIINSRGIIVNFVSLQEDISEIKNMTRQLQHQTSHDPLTGLINRRELARRLDNTIDLAIIDNSTHVLCFLELDHFKILNDTSGHLAGDALLMQIGSILKNQIRANDTVARVGGDEFALLLNNCCMEQAIRMLEDILSIASSTIFMWEDKLHRISLSAGITQIDASNIDAIEVMKQVDIATYTAKDNGGNRIHVYSGDNSNISRYRAETHWVPELRTALQEQRFKLFAQKIIPLRSSEEKPGYEILIRLVNRDGQLVQPSEFLPAAERYGLSAFLDRCVFDRLYQWLSMNPDPVAETQSFSINLSGASMSDSELLEHMIRTITCGDIASEKFHFEITETAAVTNIVQAQNFMTKLRMIGCQLVLDDFGRGLSSFAYLKNLPIDVLKIDGQFVKEILRNKADYTMVKMINELAHSLNFKTVAEFIEEEQVLDCVKEIGIDYAQGYAIARPADLNEIFSLSNSIHTNFRNPD